MTVELDRVLDGRCVARGCFTEADQAAVEAAGDVTPPPTLLPDYITAAAEAGVPCVCAMMRLDARLAEARGDHAHAATLLTALSTYLRDHPVDCGG